MYYKLFIPNVITTVNVLCCTGGWGGGLGWGGFWGGFWEGRTVKVQCGNTIFTTCLSQDSINALWIFFMQ